MKKFHVVLVATGLLLLALLIYKIGPSALWQQFTLLGPALVPLILLEGVGYLFHTQAWRHCLGGSHRSLPFGRLFCFLMAGGSINYLTPTAGLGGEVTKGVLLASGNKGAQAASSVVLDKLSRALSELVFVAGGCAMLLYTVAMPRAMWLALLVATALLGCGIIGFLIIQVYGKLGSLTRWAAGRGLGGTKLEKVANSMTEVDGELLQFYHTRPLDLAWSVAWHLAGLVWGVVPAFYFLYVTTDSVSVWMAGCIVVLGAWFDLVAFAVPVDIGVQEATRVLSFTIMGLSSALGLTYGVMRRLQQLFWAGIGLLLYGLLVYTRPSPLPTTSDTGDPGSPLSGER